MEKIAVQCKTEEEWNVVRGKLATRARWRDFVNGGHSDCIGSGGWSPRSWYEKQGFKIITAQEYLNEGGKDVKEFSVGDRVICRCGENQFEYIKRGELYTIEEVNSSTVSLRGISDVTYYKKHFELISTKPKTTKENKMNISDNILEVFTTSKDAKKVANRFGDQYGNSERDLLALRRDATDLLAIIKDEEDDAREAKEKCK